MERIKAGRPVIDFVKLCFAADRPPMLSGCHGVGKSELLQQAAAELRIECITRDLSLLEPSDLIGLPKMDGETTKYLPPDFLPTSGKGLLIFEELNRCERFMQAPCLQLLTARTLNDYQLPPGWLPAAAINPADEGYDVFTLDAAVLSRFVQVAVVSDQRSWLIWARRNNVHSAVLDYVDSDPTVFDAPESNPRAWEYVSDLIKAGDRERTSHGILHKAIIGQVGEERGIAFINTLTQKELPLEAEEVLSAYEDHRAKVQLWISRGKLDLAEMTLLSVQKYLQPDGDYTFTKGDRSRWRNLAWFLHDLPGDLQERMREYFREREYTFPRRPKRLPKG